MDRFPVRVREAGASVSMKDLRARSRTPGGAGASLISRTLAAYGDSRHTVFKENDAGDPLFC